MIGKISKRLINIYILIIFGIFCGSSLFLNVNSAKAANGIVLLSAEVQDSSITLDIPYNTVNLNLNAGTSALGTADLPISVTTTNTTGYTLMMLASTSSLTRTEAVDGSYPTIPTLAENIGISGNFPANRWGYSLSGDTEYRRFNENGTQINYSSSAVTNDIQTVTFAGKADYTIATGTYNLTLTITATANPITQTITNLTYLQDMSTLSSDGVASVLGSMTTGTSYPLADSRDGQNYTVAKLADDKVWMTRNLAIGCDGLGNNYGSGIVSKTLTSDNTNITSSPYTTTTNSLANKISSTEPAIACSTTYGAWYNYTAASTKSTTNYNATEDICPAGWRLPTKTEIDGLISAIGQDPTTFNPLTGGAWGSGAIALPAYGQWWTATANAEAGTHWYLYYNSGRLYSYGSGNGSALGHWGNYVRCIYNQ